MSIYSKQFHYINSSTPFGVVKRWIIDRRLKPTAIHVKPYRAKNNKVGKDE